MSINLNIYKYKVWKDGSLSLETPIQNKWVLGFCSNSFFELFYLGRLKKEKFWLQSQ